MSWMRRPQAPIDPILDQAAALGPRDGVALLVRALVPRLKRPVDRDHALRLAQPRRRDPERSKLALDVTLEVVQQLLLIIGNHELVQHDAVRGATSDPVAPGPVAGPGPVTTPDPVAPLPPVASPPALPSMNAALLSQFMASSFVSDGEGHGAMPLADPQVNQPPLLTMPQHA
jgi:hypothetical protein